MMPLNSSGCIAADICGILSTPFQFRCHKLNAMINSYSPRDLQSIYPQLIESIFNSRGGQGWGLLQITQASSEFEMLLEFFSPLGPFLRLCYRLLDDNIKFLLPISYLPQMLKSKLAGGNDLPNFYKETLTYNSKGLVLVLNSFDYYIFNFALHLCNDSHCPEILDGHDSVSVYRALCCDYLHHFLRCDGDSTVLPDLAMLKDRSKIPPVVIPRVAQTPRLIRITETLSESPGNKDIDNNSFNYSQTHWRTETVLTVFSDIWFCSDVAFETKNVSGYIVTENNNSVLPSIEYIKLIRIVVKHFHSFAMSMRYDPNPSFTQLKISTWKTFQDKFYLFLKQMLNRWPMDHNFILIVEMWLSFIQPWRYDRCNPPGTGPLEINHQCRSFIMDNILAYTQTFQQILSRVERLDLVVSKNASMLHRIAKVLSHSPLPEILYEIEVALTEPVAESPSPNTSSGSPKLNQSLNETFRIADAIRLRINQLEGPEFKYRSMFNKSVLYEITRLLRYMQECIILSKRQVSILENTLKQRKTGFMNFFKYFFDLVETSDLEQSIKEGKKIPGYLEVSSQYLCQIFNIDYNELKNRICEQLKNSETFSSDPSISIAGTSFNSMHTSGSHYVLNNSQVGIKEYARSIGYMGDPDLVPASSNEIKLFVDQLFCLSKHLNTKYENEIKKLWYNQNFTGRIARQLLMPPMIAKSYVKTKFDYSSLQSTPLPPRLSLRPLASMKLWIYLSIILLLGFLIGYSWPFTSFLLLVIFSLYIFIRAIFWDSGILSEEEVALKSALPKVKVSLSPKKDDSF